MEPRYARTMTSWCGARPWSDNICAVSLCTTSFSTESHKHESKTLSFQIEFVCNNALYCVVTHGDTRFGRPIPVDIVDRCQLQLTCQTKNVKLFLGCALLASNSKGNFRDAHEILESSFRLAHHQSHVARARPSKQINGPACRPWQHYTINLLIYSLHHAPSV